MELEECRKMYEELKEHKAIVANIDTEFFFRFTDIVLQALDNSIPKEKVEKIEKYCKTKSKFQTFGDEQLERAIEMYVNKTKKDVLSLLEE